VYGKVHSFETQSIPAREAQPSRRDDDGKWFPAVEAREAYEVHEVNILTDAVDGGFLSVRARVSDLPTVPVGEAVAWVVRGYAGRERSSSGTWFNRVLYYYEKSADSVRISVKPAPALASASA